MSARDPLSRLVSKLWDDSGRLPVWLEDVDYCAEKKTKRFHMRGICGELLSYKGITPQIIELPIWAVTLLEDLTNADEPDFTFPMENVGPHGLTYELEPIFLVPYGIDPASLISIPKYEYHAILSLIAVVGTVSSPVEIMNEVQIKDLVFKTCQ